MKKASKISLFGAGLLLLGGIGFGFASAHYHNTMSMMTLAEGEEETTGTVVIDKVEHGTISVDKTEGNVGDIITITAKHDLLYKIEFIKANDVQLIESETTSGVYSFTLSAGENKITSSFIIDKELCGDLTKIVEQINNKDWNHLFSVENVILLVKWLLDGGILIALIRYYVKDKKLERKLEEATKDTINKIIPQTTKDTVIKTIKEVISPIFAQTQADTQELKQAMNVFAKCFALAQENTPESRRAILDELTTLKFGDVSTITTIKKYIDDLIENHEKTYREAMEAIAKLKENNQEVIESNEAEVPVEPEEDPVNLPDEDGTSI